MHFSSKVVQWIGPHLTASTVMSSSLIVTKTINTATKKLIFIVKHLFKDRLHGNHGHTFASRVLQHRGMLST